MSRRQQLPNVSIDVAQILALDQDHALDENSDLKNGPYCLSLGATAPRVSRVELFPLR